MTERIFISYAYQDHDLVPTVQDALRKRGNDVVFLDVDPHDFKPGEDIRRMIKERISSANKVVIIASDHSANSDWVNYEAGMAAALEKPIVVMARKGSVEMASLIRALGNVQPIEIGSVT